MAGVIESFVCPICSAEFKLRGSRLRNWRTLIKTKPDTVGPYCSYLCANQVKIKVAQAARRAIFEARSSGASSNLVNAADS